MTTTSLLRLPRRVARRIRRAVAGPPGTAPDPQAGWSDVDGPELVKHVDCVLDPRRTGVGLVVLLPHLELARMTGGPNTALNLGARIAATGLPVRFVATHSAAALDEAGLRAHVQSLAEGAAGGSITFESVGHDGLALTLGRRDVVMATWWPTAHIARTALGVTSADEFLYLVQDFEPGFYPWSTQYALALATYTFPIRAIYNEGLIRDHCAALGLVPHGRSGTAGEVTTSFEPAVDPDLFHRRPRRDRPQLLFYARPRNPRNAFDLGLRALRLAAQAGALDGWECWSIGDQVPALPLDRARSIQPIPWRSYPEYAALLGSSDLLVSLMLSPHTSYPPLEMAASGGDVVTNTFGVKDRAAVSAISPRIHAVAPEPEALAEAIAAAAARCAAERLAGFDARSVEPMSLPASWEASLGPVVAWTTAAIRDLAGSDAGG